MLCAECLRIRERKLRKSETELDFFRTLLYDRLCVWE